MRELLSPAFRERLMLVVTEVNGCRYCRTFHASEALQVGITDAELAELLAGQIPTDTPEEEIPAMIYARCWAESDAQPAPEYVQELIDVYGEEKAAAIHMLLRKQRKANHLQHCREKIHAYHRFPADRTRFSDSRPFNYHRLSYPSFIEPPLPCSKRQI